MSTKITDKELKRLGFQVKDGVYVINGCHTLYPAVSITPRKSEANGVIYYYTDIRYKNKFQGVLTLMDELTLAMKACCLTLDKLSKQV